MSKEELEKEAEAFVSEKADKGNFDVEKFGKAYFSESSMKQALVKFAEPREKRIEELEETIANLKEQVQSQVEATIELDKKKAKLEQKLEQTEKDLADYQFNYPSIKELSKENAELKSRDCWKSCEYANPKAELIGQHIKDVQQLPKATNLLKWFIEISNPIYFDEDRQKVKVEAEQFLKEIK